MRFALLAMLWLGGAHGLWADEWPRAGHDLARSAIADGDGPTAGRVAWATELGSSVDGSPVVLGDRVYVGTSGGVFYCLARADGGIVWSARLGGGVFSAAETDGQRVYVGCGSGMVYALDAATGTVVWRHRTRRAVLGGPALVDGRLIFGSVDGTLRAVDPVSGRTQWLVGGETPISGGLAASEGRLYYGDEAGGLYAREVASGAEVWKAKLAGKVMASPTLSGSRLLVPLVSGSALSPPAVDYMTAWDVASGARLWTVPKPGAVSVFGALCAIGETVWGCSVEGYVSDGALRGHRLSDGAAVAEVRLGRVVVDAGLAAARDALYIAAQDGVVYFANAQTGAITQRVPLGGRIFSSPAVADGRLYVGCQDGKLYCIE